VQLPIPSLKKDEVLIKVKASSINQGDWWVQKGLLRPFLPKLPFIPGIYSILLYRSIAFCMEQTFSQHITVYS
jgi:hypothetical protein